MPSRFAKRFQSYAMPMLEREHGIEGVYLVRQTGTRTDTFTARYEAITHTAYGAALGYDVRTEQRKFKIPTEHCAIAGVTFEPRKGDVIVADGESWVADYPDTDVPVAQKIENTGEWLVHCKKDVR